MESPGIINLTKLDPIDISIWFTILSIHRLTSSEAHERNKMMAGYFQDHHIVQDFNMVLGIHPLVITIKQQNRGIPLTQR